MVGLLVGVFLVARWSSYWLIGFGSWPLLLLSSSWLGFGSPLGGFVCLHLRGDLWVSHWLALGLPLACWAFGLPLRGFPASWAWLALCLAVRSWCFVGFCLSSLAAFMLLLPLLPSSWFVWLWVLALPLVLLSSSWSGFGSPLGNFVCLHLLGDLWVSPWLALGLVLAC